MARAKTIHAFDGFRYREFHSSDGIGIAITDDYRQIWGQIWGQTPNVRIVRICAYKSTETRQRCDE